MGSATSSTRQQLGERALNARAKLEAAKNFQAERLRQLQASTETQDSIVQTVGDSLKQCSPFSPALLLVAFAANPEEVQRMLTKCCKQVLSAPIRRSEYEWFQRYVFPSPVWMQRNERGEYLFEDLLHIAKSMSEKIDASMASIFEHLRAHKHWADVAAIKNQTLVERQDDECVGLLREQGLKDVLDAKHEDAEQEEAEVGLAAFIDSNLAVNMLTTTAQRIDAEFQRRVQMVMNRFGDFRAGPVKTAERCQSKVENEYEEAVYPKAAKLLDLVRCSVSFNTVEQLLAGYEGLMRHIAGTDAFELARIKNGFLLDAGAASYRDIKVNVVFHSETDPENAVSMVCEVQLVLNQFLHEKKRIHKLYGILSERRFFEMVIRQKTEDEDERKDFKQLKFEPVLNVNQQVTMSSTGTNVYKCSVDSELGLLGMNCGGDKFFCVDMSSNKVIFETAASGYHYSFSSMQTNRLTTAWGA